MNLSDFLARQLGISKRYANYLLSGQRAITSRLAAPVALSLGISATLLVGKKGNELFPFLEAFYKCYQQF